MTHNKKQQNKLLAESDILSRKLLLKETVLNVIKKVAKKYYGSDDPFDTMVAGARGSRVSNLQRRKDSREQFKIESNKVKNSFLSRQASLHPAHPEKLENQFRAETGLPHEHVPTNFVRTPFDEFAEYAQIRADPVTHAGGSTDPADWARVVRTRRQQHNINQDVLQRAHEQNEMATAEARQAQFNQFKNRKLREHQNNIITSDYNHPLTASHRILNRDKRLYDLAYNSRGTLEKYRRRGDIVRGLLTYYVSPKDSPAAKFGNLVGHHLRSMRPNKDELSPSGVSEPFGSGDSEHGPK